MHRMKTHLRKRVDAFDSIFTTFSKKLINGGGKIRVAFASSYSLGLEMQSKLMEKWGEKTFWGDGRVPYFDKGVSYKGVCICQNSQNGTPKMYTFNCM